jgi:hypothetical protein
LKNNDLPTSLVYFGTCAGVLQILKHKRLPLFRTPALKDPFAPLPNLPINFNKQELFEESVKAITAAILGKEAPRGNPNHPLQKAISRWRGEQRFSNEGEIRESLENLLPAMVEQIFAEAVQIHREWQAFVKLKAILALYANHEDSLLWYTEGKKYSGVAIRFKTEEGGPLESCLPVNYSKIPPSTVRIKDTVDLLTGMSQALPKEFETTLNRQNSLFKSQKEWRLILDRDKPEEMYVEYPSNLIQSIYVGPLVDEDKIQQILDYSQLTDKNIKVYRAEPLARAYELVFTKLN